MAETLGSLIDKICIAELKIYHMQEQTLRTDVAPSHRALCREKLAVLRRQRDDLVEEMEGLLSQWRKGTWAPRVYRQFKMYNDPRFRVPSPV